MNEIKKLDDVPRAKRRHEVLNAQYYDAVWYGTAEDIESLLEDGADVNYRGPGVSCGFQRPPAYLVVRRNDRKKAELLVKHGLDVNARDEAGETALVFALHEGAYETAITLVKGGADLSVRDYRGRTPLELAVADGWHGKKVARAIGLRVAIETVDMGETDTP
jgi:ankyrin repeat protein